MKAALSDTHNIDTRHHGHGLSSLHENAGLSVHGAHDVN